MGQVDYNHINQLQRQVDQHRASLSTATAEIASIDEKLERLRCARLLLERFKEMFIRSRSL